MILKLLDRYTYTHNIFGSMTINTAHFFITVVTMRKRCRTAISLGLRNMILRIYGQPELAHTAKTQGRLITNMGVFRGNRGCRTALYLHLLKGTFAGMPQYFSGMAQA
jgi:hypothetical protein